MQNRQKPRKDKVPNYRPETSNSEPELLGFLPGVVGVAEVAVGSGLEVLRLLEVKFTDYREV